MAMSLEKRTANFFKKLYTVHGDKYDTVNVNYVNNTTEIELICATHGKFNITPMSLLAGGNCQKCGYEKRAKANNTFGSIEELEEELHRVHNHKFKYIIKSASVNHQISVICPIHGLYETQAYIHLTSGCRKCFNASEKSLKRTTEEYIFEAKQIHGNRFDYSLTKYNGVKNTIDIICYKHGVFTQNAGEHLYGNGCSKCSSSKGENKIIEFLNNAKIDFIFQKSFNQLKSKKKLRYDFFIPTANTIIEFDGIQHFKKVNFSGKFTEEELIENLRNIQYYDSLKNAFASENNINLIRINYLDIDNINEILSSYFSLYISRI